MKYKAISDRYKQLENDVIGALKAEINKSKHTPKSYDCKSIKVDIFGNTELAILDGELIFLDDDGLQYSLYADCCLEDLIDILTAIK